MLGAPPDGAVFEEYVNDDSRVRFQRTPGHFTALGGPPSSGQLQSAQSVSPDVTTGSVRSFVYGFDAGQKLLHQQLEVDALKATTAAERALREAAEAAAASERARREATVEAALQAMIAAGLSEAAARLALQSAFK